MGVVTGTEAGIIGGLGALRISGAEAEAFLQRMLANDVKALGVGDWQWNLLLTPQGRVLSLFRLLRRSGSEFVLVLPSAWATATRETLERYRLRAKVLIEEEAAQWVGGPVSADRAATRGELRDTMFSSDGRFLAPAAGSPADDPPPTAATAAETIAAPESKESRRSQSAEAHWRAADVASGVPWIDSQGLDAQTPQALALDRLAAYSVRKGCYPGQEIVSRLHFLGQSKRALRRFATAMAVAPGTELVLGQRGDRVVGNVVACAGSAPDLELLAVCQSVDGAAEFHLRGSSGAPLLPLEFDPPPLPLRNPGQRESA